MSAAVERMKMGAAVERLTKLADAGDRFDIPAAELLPTQLEAVNELLLDRINKIRLLRNRAETGGVSAIREQADIVPLLFAHTAYKSYPEGWLTERKWDRLGKWLETVSTHPIVGVDTASVRNIDDWIEKLQSAGHFVSCSSGTTGKSAMLNGSTADMAWSRKDSVSSFSWGSGVTPAQDRKMFGLAPVASVPRNLVIRAALIDAISLPGSTPFTYPVPPITIGQITGMVALRKSIADGTAKPADIAAYEATSAERQKVVDKAIGLSAEAVVQARGDKLFLSGMWASLHKIAEAVRALGYGGKDFHPDNTIYVGGGLKGAVLPPNYREYVFETFNLSPDRVFQMYGMQEINTGMPRRLLRPVAGRPLGRRHFRRQDCGGLRQVPLRQPQPVDPRQHHPLRRSPGRRQDQLLRHHRCLCARCGMNTIRSADLGTVVDSIPAIPVRHFVRGKLVSGADVRHRSRDLGADFTTPAIDLDALIMPRSEAPPLLDVKVSEIIDFLVETGERLTLERNPYLQESLERVAATNPLPRRVVENLYKGARQYLTRDVLKSSIDSNFSNPACLDGWVPRTDMHGQRGSIRAFPPRMIHMLAGNSPAGCMSSIAQGALVKAVNLFKMPSTDPFTCVAVLRTMADIDPNHPVVHSMSAVYWRGGDESIERTVYRPQYFDRIVAWGGGDAINNVIRYLGPGLQLISFDPKTSISMIGPEAFQ
jgi:hypothetical protein